MLNNHQQEIHDKIVSTIADNPSGGRHIVFAGYAGTGKTFTAARLIDTLRAKGHKLAICGPTHKSCKVLREKMGSDGVPVETAHSIFYKKPSDKLAHVLTTYNTTTDPHLRAKAKEQLEMMRGQSSMNFQLNMDSNNNADVIIVDESSMIPEDMVYAARTMKANIIWIGDGGQLPPVGQKPGIDLEHPDYRLTKIVRTAEGSSIPVVADNVRHAMSRAELRTILQAARRDYPETFVKDHLPTGQVLCWTNSTRRMMNNALRPDNSAILVKGEKYLIHKGVDDLVIGDEVELLNFSPVDGNKFLYTVELLTETGETKVLDISTSDLDPRGDAKRNGLEVAEANYDSLERKTRVVLAYRHCITVHKSQGSEWSNVNIITDHLLGPNTKMGLADTKKWLYTAITRAKERVFIT